MVVRSAIVWTMLVFTAGCGPKEEPPIDIREPCADRNELRNLYFGDLHVHTELSFDAWIYDVRLGPDDAYRFAQGESVLLPPLDETGTGTVPAQLDRPLDFAAVTDHSEYLAEVSSCTTAGSVVYESDVCKDYRAATVGSIQRIGTILANPNPSRIEEICGAGGINCLEESGDVWRHIQASAEDAYDRTATCSFTSFVAYEWSGATNVTNFHRNVIFRNHVVPALPISYFEEPSPEGLWQALRADCLEKEGGCDVLAIPHNSNYSNGNLFFPTYPIGEEEAEWAAFRAQMEPVVEIYQHKGDSECLPAISGILGAEDELCGFEKVREEPVNDCGDEPGAGGMAMLGCVHRLDTVRGALLEGMKEELRIGVNPFALGLIASTDTHSGTPGRVEESTYTGHLGIDEASPEGRLKEPGLNPGGITNSPGGLAAIWAEENSRDALFDAIRRREVYGTSGPRIAVRFFGGWEFESGACEDPNILTEAYERGVPMGSNMPVQQGGGAPTFIVQAFADPDSAIPLQQVQIVKGTVNDDGQASISVFDLMEPSETATVNLSTCAPTVTGKPSFCTTWADPDFAADEKAFYYVRVLEDPTCRWSWRDCVGMDEGERPETCADESVPKTVQERAWTSPIWYGAN